MQTGAFSTCRAQGAATTQHGGRGYSPTLLPTTKDVVSSVQRAVEPRCTSFYDTWTRARNQVTPRNLIARKWFPIRLVCGLSS